jgi:outer membrane protein
MGATGVRAYILAVVSLCSSAAGFGIGCGDAQADTLEWALVQAYQNNPSLNAQRASLRATDENVPQALSGYRPKLSLTAAGGYNYQSSTSVFPLAGALITSPFAQNFYSRTIGATGTYTVQRLPDRQSEPSGGKSGGRGARDLACHRAAGAARCRDRLNESVARSAPGV